MESDNVIYFQPGDLVRLNKDLPNSPVMLVVNKEVSILSSKTMHNRTLMGIKCRWFTADGTLQEAVWSTKDLYKIK